MQSRFGWLALCCAISACGGGSKSSPPVISQFTAAPAQLALGGGSATLSWTATDATSLKIDQGVGEVTGQSQKSVSVAQTTTYTLTASNEAGETKATATVTVATSGTIHGTVVGIYGAPASGATVYVVGKSPTTSDAQGQFSVADVTPPYDLVVVAPHTSGAGRVEIFKGITSPTPVVNSASGQNPVPALHTQVSGKVLGDPGRSNELTFFAADGGLSKPSLIMNSDGTYSATVTYDAPLVGSAMVLQSIAYADGGMTSTRFGRLDGIALDGGSSITALDIPTSPITSIKASVHMDRGASDDLSVNAYLWIPERAKLNYWSGTGAGDVEIDVPQVAQATLRVLANTDSTSGNRTAVLEAPLNTTQVNVPSFTSPAITSPLKGANSVNGNTVFSWSPMTTSNGPVLYLLVLSPSSSANPTISVATRETQVQLPALDALGISLAKGASYTAGVSGLAPESSVEHFVGAYFDIAQIRLEHPPGLIAQSPTISFTTAP